jgi:uncharacterized protein (DUF488 family)
MATRLLTIGHSTRTLDEFLALLRAHEVERVVDVRSLPRSRRMPHFSGPSLAPSLAEAGLDYTHIPDLGGLRGPSTAPEYAGLPEAFRGYGAHMETPRFRAALDELIRLASEQRVALLCAEAEPKSCHRSLIADALFARGLEVAHIVDLGPPLPHELTRAAVIRDGRLSYPRKQVRLELG